MGKNKKTSGHNNNNNNNNNNTSSSKFKKTDWDKFYNAFYQNLLKLDENKFIEWLENDYYNLPDLENNADTSRLLYRSILLNRCMVVRWLFDHGANPLTTITVTPPNTTAYKIFELAFLYVCPLRTNEADVNANMPILFLEEIKKRNEKLPTYSSEPFLIHLLNLKYFDDPMRFDSLQQPVLDFVIENFNDNNNFIDAQLDANGDTLAYHLLKGKNLKAAGYLLSKGFPLLKGDVKNSDAGYNKLQDLFVPLVKQDNVAPVLGLLSMHYNKINMTKDHIYLLFNICNVIGYHKTLYMSMIFKKVPESFEFNLNYIAPHKKAAPLLMAIQHGIEESVDFFLKNNTSISILGDGFNAIQIALITDHSKDEKVRQRIIEKVLSASSDLDLEFPSPPHGLTALFIAIQRKNVGAIKLLLQRGVKRKITLNDNSELSDTVYALDRDFLNEYNQLNVGQSSPDLAFLKLCSSNDNIENIKNTFKSEFLDYRDENGNTALIIASTLGCDAIVEFLLLKNANPEIGDFEGNTPLKYAARSGNIKTFILLYNANPNLLNKPNKKGVLPFTWMVTDEKCKNAVAYLLENKYIDVNAIDNKGFSALYAAVQEEALWSIELLLKHGADLRQQNNPITALDIACANGHLSIAKLLYDAELHSSYDVDIEQLTRSFVLTLSHEKNDIIQWVITETAFTIEIKCIEFFSPLSLAVILGKASSVKLLLDLGAACFDTERSSKNATENYCSPIFMAALIGDANKLKLLLERVDFSKDHSTATHVREIIKIIPELKNENNTLTGIQELFEKHLPKPTEKNTSTDPIPETTHSTLDPVRARSYLKKVLAYNDDEIKKMQTGVHERKTNTTYQSTNNNEINSTQTFCRGKILFTELKRLIDLKPINGSTNCFIYIDSDALISSDCPKEELKKFEAIQPRFHDKQYRTLNGFKIELSIEDIGEVEVTHEAIIPGVNRALIYKLPSDGGTISVYVMGVYAEGGLHKESQIKSWQSTKKLYPSGLLKLVDQNNKVDINKNESPYRTTNSTPGMFGLHNNNNNNDDVDDNNVIRNSARGSQ